MQSLAVPPWVGLALMALVCGLAAWRGGWEERTTAMAFMIAWMTTLLGRDQAWIGAQWGTLVVDLILLAFLLLVALRGDKYWPLFAAGFHLLSVVTHMARMVDAQVGAWAYATAAVIFSQMTVFALGAGMISILLRDWRDSRSRRALQ